MMSLSLRHAIDPDWRERIHVEVGGRVVTVTVIRTDTWFHDRKTGRRLPHDRRAIARALAHHVTGYRGSLSCRLCAGRSSDCWACRDGVPRFVCGDCDEPLPNCRCLRRMSLANLAAYGQARAQ